MIETLSWTLGMRGERCVVLKGGQSMVTLRVYPAPKHKKGVPNYPIENPRFKQMPHPLKAADGCGKEGLAGQLGSHYWFCRNFNSRAACGATERKGRLTTMASTIVPCLC